MVQLDFARAKCPLMALNKPFVDALNVRFEDKADIKAKLCESAKL